ncbi:MAG: hypothetical protein WBC18_20450 [Ottowia sp.]|uniref:hypothetical protein n=1 Tax=Ottowia sp. TaxID=1898956 RepID=UPI003C7395F9
MNTNTNAAPDPTIADTGADTLIEDLECAILSVVQSSGGLDRIREAKDALRTALSTAAQPPAGMVIVPVEPTPEMLDAAAHASMQHLLDCIKDPERADELGSVENIRKSHASRYRSMIEAAPKAEPVQQPERVPLTDEAIDLLSELHALVWGECPSLLNEDSGGNSALDLRIRDCIQPAHKEQPDE